MEESGIERPSAGLCMADIAPDFGARSTLGPVKRSDYRELAASLFIPPRLYAGALDRIASSPVS